jgi:hypothetical protein
MPIFHSAEDDIANAFVVHEVLPETPDLLQVDTKMAL